jgi:GGDEF domain-containing protein
MPSSIEQDLQAHEPCSCLPLSPLQGEGEYRHGQEEFLLVAPELYHALRRALASFFPRSAPFSLFLLHITQFKHIQMPPTSAVIHQRLSFHASADLQEQVLHNIRRSLRASDQILANEQGTGAVILFPQVDQEGSVRIAERILRSINLLQAETVVPPLRYETEISIGFASYPKPASSLEELLSHAGRMQEKITFRPAVVPRRGRPLAQSGHTRDLPRNSRTKEARELEERANGIPFMQIPRRLPARLKQLIPYPLALKLRCAPVGRNHNRLTVAMANPMDAQALYYLREATGMVIFPVACEITDLDTLLASGW